MPATIQDICEATKLPAEIVSRALAGDTSLTPDIRERVICAAERLRYPIPGTAPAQPREPRRTVGIVFHELTSGFYSQIMTGIDLEASKQGLQLLIAVAKPLETGLASPYELLDHAGIDGLAILDATLTPERVFQLKASGRPLVIIQNTLYDKDVSAVVPDNIGGAYLAMKHLLGQGHRRILIIAGTPATEDSDLRLQGCQKAVAEAGLSMNNMGVIAGFFKASEALHAFDNYRSRHGLPEAVFAFNDDMALALLKHLRKEGLRVPDDTAIVGFDGIAAADLMDLTTVQVPMVDLGREAIRLLTARLRDPSLPPQQVVMKTSLIVRESSMRGGQPPAKASTKPA